MDRPGSLSYIRTMHRLALIFLATMLSAQTFDPKLYSGLRWRDIGPFRGGRTVGAAGHRRPAQRLLHRRQQRRRVEDRRLRPHLEAASSTTSRPARSAPSRWRPPTPTSSTWAAAKGCSGPTSRWATACTNRPTAARRWRHLGLRDAQQIPAILVDPRNPNRLFVAVLGHPYGPNAERGVFRSTDGGQTWQKVLYKDDRTGRDRSGLRPAQSAERVRGALAGAAGAVGERRVLRPEQRPLQIHRRRHDVEPARRRAADLRAGWTGAHRDRHRARATAIACTRWWRRAARRAACIAPTMPARHWKRVNGEQRIYGRGGDFACVRVDPKNKDVIYVANTSTYRSTDAGQSFTAIKGAPGGDDYHTIWINPEQPQHHPAGRRPGSHHQRELRRDLEFLVQPADRAVLSRDHRQPVALLGLRRPAGERLGGRRQPRQRRRRSRSATGTPWAPTSMATSRPTRSNPNIIYGGKGTQLQPRHRRSGGRRNPQRQLPLPAHRAAAVLATSIRTCSTWARRWC